MKFILGFIIGILTLSSLLYLQPSWFIEQEQSIITKTPLPYILTHNREVEIGFKELDGSSWTWKLPFELLENQIKMGYYTRELNKNTLSYITLKKDNQRFKVIDYRKFIVPNIFSGFATSIYSSSKGEQEFIKEIWNFVTQLSNYASEDGDIPRYPLETLLAGGGDCEDTSILFASIIKATPVNWQVSLLCIDANSPENPKTVNHVIVKVKTDNQEYFIETTNNEEMLPYTQEGISYWELKL